MRGISSLFSSKYIKNKGGIMKKSIVFLIIIAIIIAIIIVIKPAGSAGTLDNMSYQEKEQIRQILFVFICGILGVYLLLSPKDWKKGCCVSMPFLLGRIGVLVNKYKQVVEYLLK